MMRKLDNKSFYRTIHFVILFFTYTNFHIIRKSYSNLKPTIIATFIPTFFNVSSQVEEQQRVFPTSIWQSHTTFDKQNTASFWMGMLDTIFNIIYLISLFFWGILGDRISAKYLLSLAMIVNSVTLVLADFLLPSLCDVTNFFVFAGSWLLSGFLQSPGWPLVFILMNNWFSGKYIGLVFGLFNMSSSLGNLMADKIDSKLIAFGYDYQTLVVVSIPISFALILACGLIEHPVESHPPITVLSRDQSPSMNTLENDINTGQTDKLVVNWATIDDVNSREDREELIRNDVDYQSNENEPRLRFKQILFLPSLALFTLAVSFSKIVQSYFFYWLTMYMVDKYSYTNEQADNISFVYDLGSLFSPVLFGLISDILPKRSFVPFVGLVFTIPFLLFWQMKITLERIKLCFFFIAFLLTGSNSTITTPIVADLGRRNKSIGSLTAIVEGTSSFLVAISQFIIPLVAHRSVSLLNYIFVGFITVSIIIMSPIIYNDVKSVKNDYSQ